MLRLGPRTFHMLAGSEKQLVHETFEVTSVLSPTLSMGKLSTSGYEFVVRDGYSVMRKGAAEIRIDKHRNSFWVAVEILQRKSSVQPVQEGLAAAMRSQRR